MPVPSELVPLDTAKSWAKRLQRASKIIAPQAPWPLSKCQMAVAQMLGFEHWHALNKAAQAPPEINAKAELEKGLTSPNKQLPELAAPASQEGWMELWEEVMGDAVRSGVSDIHIQHSGDSTQIRWRVSGDMIDVARIMGEEIALGLSYLMPDASSRGFLRDVGLTPRDDTREADEAPYHSGYVNTLISVGSRKGHMQWIPTYPKGWEAVIRLYPDNEMMSEHTLKKTGLFKDVQDAIRKVASHTRPGKILVFSGSVGTGKTRLMQALINDITGDNPTLKGAILGNPPEIINRALVCVPVLRTVVKENWENELKENWSQGLHAILRGDPGLVVIEETHQHSVHATAIAAKSGSSVFTTLQAEPGRALNQLQALDSTQNWAQMVSGWVDTRLLPLLCPECSLHSGSPGRERRRGDGCGQCRHRSLKGRIPVADVCKIRDGKLVKISCMKDQARRLIADGVLDRKMAEETLGRLEE